MFELNLKSKFVSKDDVIAEKPYFLSSLFNYNDEKDNTELSLSLIHPEKKIIYENKSLKVLFKTENNTFYSFFLKQGDFKEYGLNFTEQTIFSFKFPSSFKENEEAFIFLNVINSYQNKKNLDLSVYIHNNNSELGRLLIKDFEFLLSKDCIFCNILI